jgi:hypothetical protein
MSAGISVSQPFPDVGKRWQSNSEMVVARIVLPDIGALAGRLCGVNNM